VPTTAPEYAIFRDRGQTGDERGIFGDSPEWSSAFILVPWQQYEFDGDLNLFRAHYDAMTNYLGYLGSRADNDIVNYGLGDWYDLGPKPPGSRSSRPLRSPRRRFIFKTRKSCRAPPRCSARTMTQRQFSELAQNIRTAFNARFYDPTNHFYATGSQTANSIPLVMGLCDPTIATRCSMPLSAMFANAATR
jgi:alpha-L-rhamnosidase